MCGGMIGNGTTVTLSVDGAIAYVQSLEMPTWAAEAVDFTNLDNVDFMCFKYSGLADGGEFVAEVYMDPETVLPTMGTVQVATIVNTDGTSTRTIAGSGFITELNLGNAAPGEAILGTITFKFDGDGTVPSITLATPTVSR